MLVLQKSDLADIQKWTDAGIELPQFDIEKTISATKQSPTWIHFGAGNIFRGFIAGLQQRLLNQNLAQTGIIAVVPFDYNTIERIFKPFDYLTLYAIMNEDGTLRKEVVASRAEFLPHRVCRWSALQLQKKAIHCAVLTAVLPPLPETI